MYDGQRYPFSEDRLNQVRKNKKTAKVKSILIMAGCLAAMVLVMYFTAMLCSWIDTKMTDDAMDAALALGIKDQYGNDINADGNIVDKDGNVIVTYTQTELDRKLNEAKQEAASEVLDALRQGISEGDSMLQVIRGLYQDELIVSSGGQYHFVPMDKNLKMHTYRQENLNILESGEYQYVENGQITSYKGVDVSKFQGKIDWEKVAADGVQFAFVRVGYRGYGAEGKLVEDEYFEENIKGALSAGIKVGVYFYSQAINETEAVQEANFVLERIAPYKIECPVVIDVEMVGTSSNKGRMDALNVQERTDVVKKFCETIENAGYSPMVYYNLEVGIMKVKPEQLEQYPKWFASYSDSFYYPYAFDVWQYTASGSVAGIKGEVDMNISFVPLWE